MTTESLGRLVTLAALCALVTGCATSSTVVLPDGSTAYDVQCFAGRWGCTSEAKDVCGGDSYVVLDENEVLGMVTHDRQGSMRIQCSTDYVASRLPPPPAPGPGPVPKTNDVLVCRRAYGDIAKTAPAWSAARARSVRAEPPPEGEFARGCAALPARAQLCLNMVYREHHGSLCDQTMDMLADESKRTLDGLLLVPAGSAASRDGQDAGP